MLKGNSILIRELHAARELNTESLTPRGDKRATSGCRSGFIQISVSVGASGTKRYRLNLYLIASVFGTVCDFLINAMCSSL